MFSCQVKKAKSQLMRAGEGFVADRPPGSSTGPETPHVRRSGAENSLLCILRSRINNIEEIAFRVYSDRVGYAPSRRVRPLGRRSRTRDFPNRRGPDTKYLRRKSREMALECQNCGFVEGTKQNIPSRIRKYGREIVIVMAQVLMSYYRPLSPTDRFRGGPCPNCGTRSWVDGN